LQLQADAMEKQLDGFGKTLSEIRVAIGALVTKQGETQEMMLKLDH
jgi:hypothetical protein